MHKEEFLKKLNDALANETENENGIERIIVFYKSGKKLQICAEEIDDEVLDAELGVEKSAPSDKDDSTYKDGDWKFSKNETEEKEIGKGTPEVIYFPTGRKINVIY